MNSLSRPTKIQELLERLSRFQSEQALAGLANLSVRPSDVFIATYSKSGTTWMQQVVHQLRTGGDADFDEITAVVPWVDMAVDMGFDPDADQTGVFRAFKTHKMYSELPAGARYITVFRDPVTVLPSLFQFLEGWWFEPGSISIEDFAREVYLRGTASGWHCNHFIDWYPRIGEADTLALCYEDMVRAPDDVPPLVSAFLGLSPEPSVMQTIVHNCSRDFMSGNSALFDDHLLRNARDEYWGLPPGGSSNKARAASAKVSLSDVLLEVLRETWGNSVRAELGFENYAEFRSSLPNPLGVDRS